MDETPTSTGTNVVRPARSRRALIACVLGFLGGAGAAGSMWLPLATVAGLGSVGPRDFSRSLFYPVVAVAVLTAIFNLARCFRIVLLTAGVMCGLIATVLIELFQNLREFLNQEGGDIAHIAQQVLTHSSLQAGAYLLPVCCLACVVAGFLGSGVRRAATSG